MSLAGCLGAVLQELLELFRLAFRANCVTLRKQDAPFQGQLNGFVEVASLLVQFAGAGCFLALLADLAQPKRMIFSWIGRNVSEVRPAVQKADFIFRRFIGIFLRVSKVAHDLLTLTDRIRRHRAQNELIRMHQA